jgi:HPt (histidine-containing phosphotransfer) domain-containing protein
MPIIIPGIDTKAGLTLYDDDVDVYKTILRFFVTKIPAVLDTIRNVSSETLPDYTIKIHALKGSSGSIGANETMAAAGKLEAMAKNGDLAGIQAGNDAFLEKTHILVDDIKKWLDQFGEST